MSYMQLIHEKKNSVRLAAVSLAFVLLMIFMIAARAKNEATATKPNIIVILIDDAGYADFGFMGSKELHTPNIDELTSTAVRFTDAHVSASVCSPSRAGLLTGKYQQRFGYECNEGEGYTGMDTSQIIIPKLLQQQGYATAAFGKWHLGFEASQHPLQKGFQYYYGFLSGGRSYFYKPDKDDRKGAKNALLENHQQVKFDGYLTDVLGDKAVDYIRKNNDHPFFMYWAPNAVHTPMDASEADLKKFAGHPRQQLAAMTFALDRAIGKMIAELKKLGLYDNTLIFFLSDNGGAHNNQSSNFPLKGFKGNKYEAGHRIPFLVSWPEKFKGGTDFKGLTSSLDIFPTVLEAAGVQSNASLKLDGNSLLPFLRNEKKGMPHEQLIWRKDAEAAIRFNQYKLIRVKGLGERLYDLEKDPDETTDLQLQQPELFAAMQQRLRLWEQDKMKPIWTEGAMWDTITLMIHDDLMHNRKVRVHNPEELQQFRLTK
jgi:arylsulfatase A-like enzyme